MIFLIAESNTLTLDYPIIAGIATPVLGGGTVFVTWLWLRFKKTDREKDERLKVMDAAIKDMQQRMNKMESTLSGQSQFVSAVIGASQNGEAVPSKVIHALHAQYKPTDRTGTYHPIQLVP